MSVHEPPLNWADKMVTEAEFQRTVVAALKAFGWHHYHDRVAWKSDPGWPDLVCWSERQRRLLFLELKKENGKVSDAQAERLASLRAAGQEAGVFRPSDWGRLVRVLEGERMEVAA